jgi:hypothetical protein
MSGKSCNGFCRHRKVRGVENTTNADTHGCTEGLRSNGKA